jgi:Ni,Fe-hydrogenase I large subunit
MTHILVDPATRIGGHLRIEAEADGADVNDAWSVHVADAGRRELARVRVV